LGRDILSRIIYGSRLSLLIGFVSICIGSGIGTMVGLVAGYQEGWVEAVIMRIVDAMLAFPGILLALAIIAGLGPSLRNVMLAVGIATVPQFARLTRGIVLSVKKNDFVSAAHIVGCSGFRIVLRHILPNVIAPVIVLATLQFGVAILSAASLSFLGLGAQPPTPEWGLMVSVGRVYLGKAWWMSIFPGFTITVAVVGVNLVGDGLREALDPRLRSR
jgi:peptide/nickel transport system permease protein